MDAKLEKIFKLPAKQKILLMILIMGMEGFGLFWGLYRPKGSELQQLTAKLDAMEKQVAETTKIANNLPKFRKEFEDLNSQLLKALTELPNQKEIPSLLTSITNAGKNAGLEFLMFRPKAEEPKEFYASVPVDISIAGTFYNVASFFVAVGELPRIVNITNVSFSDIRDAGGRTMVRVNCLATTFRFIDKNPTDKKENKK
jgi:type IV pilus assembly protein PilO